MTKSLLCSFVTAAVSISFFVPQLLHAQIYPTPLPIPPILDGPNYQLTMDTSHHVFTPHGYRVPTYSYNGMGYLGPTILWHTGDSVFMHVTNELAVVATNHWHGAHVPAYADGGPHHAILPGNTWSPHFKIMNEPCTQWYHPHLHMETMPEVNMGLAGLTIIRSTSDAFESQLPDSYGVDEFPLIIQDRHLIDAKFIDTMCSLGHWLLVNGVDSAYLTVPAQQVRFHLLNGSSERGWMLALIDSTVLASNRLDIGLTDSARCTVFNLIATDAGYTAMPYPMKSVMMGSGERTEWTVDFTGMPTGKAYYLVNLPEYLPPSVPGSLNPNAIPPCYQLDAADSVPMPLLKIVVGPQTASPITTIPTAFAPLKIPSLDQVSRTRYEHLYLTHGDTMHSPFKIDNIDFDESVINDTVLLGATEIWEIINVSQAAHPFHIHDIHFYITAINGRGGNAIPNYLRGPKDVVYVQDDQTIDYITTFDDFSTEPDADSAYMYHCHILSHEDGGMMHQFVVVKPAVASVSFTKDNFAPWSIYPNPGPGTLHLEADWEEATTLRIFNSLGEKAAEIPIAPVHGSLQLPLPKLASGVWMLQWSRADGVFTKRVIVQ